MFATRCGWRSRRRCSQPSTVLTLALGIGATSVIFAVVNGVLIRALPYRDTDRLVNVWSNATREGRPRNPLSPADFLDLQGANTTMESMGGYFAFVNPMEFQTDAGAETAVSIFRPSVNKGPTAIASPHLELPHPGLARRRRRHTLPFAPRRCVSAFASF